MIAKPLEPRQFWIILRFHHLSFKSRQREGELSQTDLQWFFSENKVSENRYCRQPGAATIDAETYLTLLESSRLHRDLVQEYHGQGERSVEEAAKLVGLRLPEQYSPE